MAQEEQEFKVTDRRSAFREETADTPDKEASSEQAPRAEDSGQEQQAQQTPQEQAQQASSSQPLPEANLLTLIFSLYTHVQICLGLVPDPISQQTQKDLPQAKYNIDMLGVLKEKTQGNLSKDEEQALENILYEARMTYVEVSK